MHFPYPSPSFHAGVVVATKPRVFPSLPPLPRLALFVRSTWLRPTTDRCNPPEMALLRVVFLFPQSEDAVVRLLSEAGGQEEEKWLPILPPTSSAFSPSPFLVARLQKSRGKLCANWRPTRFFLQASVLVSITTVVYTAYISMGLRAWGAGSQYIRVSRSSYVTK